MLRIIILTFMLMISSACIISPVGAVIVSEVPNLIKVPMVRQATDHTCGVASFQSVLGYYGIEVREDVLAQALKASDYARNEEIAKYAKANGLKVERHTNMTLDELKRQVDMGRLTMVCLQAWPNKPLTIEEYKNTWEDGHWVVVIGYDAQNIYFMDPSTLGHYAFVPIEEFMARWHDYEDDINKPLIHFGMIFTQEKASNYNPAEILRME